MLKQRLAPSREQTGSTVFDRIQGEIQRIRAFLALVPFLNGRYLKRITISTGAAGTYIEHGLGRPWRGWIVVRNTNFGVYPVEATTQPDSSKAIALLASSASVVDLWIF